MKDGTCKNCNEVGLVCEGCDLCDDCHDEKLVNEIMKAETDQDRALLMTYLVMQGPKGIEMVLKILFKMIGAKADSVLLSTIHHN